jgi:D-alanyl-D-alanine carboxypeptidase
VFKPAGFLDAWLRFRTERCDTPGIAVAISRKGRIVFDAAYGCADLERQEPLTTGHLFRVASHSKSFTAAAIMQLARSGKLSIDDPVAKYLGWLRGHKDRRIASLTVRQLLSHGSGMIRDGLDADHWQLRHAFPTVADVKALVSRTGLFIDSNLRMKYSNIGYGLLGLAIEAASGVPYRRFVDERVVAHAGLALKNTHSDYSGAVEKKLVTGYTRRYGGRGRKAIAKDVATGALAAATGFCSTGRDLATFFDAHFVGSKSTLLDDESRKEMQHTQWSVRDRREQREYGLGLTIEYAGKRRLFGHGGAFPGQRSCTLADPEDRTVVSVLTNFDEADPIAINKAIWSALDFFDAKAESGSRPRDGSRFEGIFVNDIWRAVQIVASDSKIIGLYPESWDPFRDVDELVYVDSTTLKATGANSYFSEGEPVRFKFAKSGAIASVNYTGTTMWPEAEYYARRGAQVKVRPRKRRA